MRAGILVLCSALCGLCLEQAAASTYSGVARLQVRSGTTLFLDSVKEDGSAVITSATRLVNEDVSYYWYPSPLPGGVLKTYFVYARDVRLTFECSLSLNGEVTYRESETVQVHLAPGLLYVAKPVFSNNHSKCHTDVSPP